ncbi:MAG: adenine-specific methyltransferase EcoRI family protein [Treponema sp.]|nr:adenine-specific methyltransferase EcoRI family protein [Treponema sp.]
MANKDLHIANKNKADEFYTQLSDIEKEMSHYKDFFKGKTILCNCDDPRISNFFKYFALNFKEFGLKKIISTCYKNQDVDLFSLNNSEKAVYIEYTGNPNDPTSTDFSTIEVKELKGDGDFRSDECIELLKQSDLVITNPPFSLFREFVTLLYKYEKKFIIIGNQNAITYKEIFPLIKQNKIWLGHSIHSGDREFGVPDSYPLKAAGSRIDENGKKFIRVKGVRWFTNIDYKERHEKIVLYKKYSEEDYPKYDNYEGINVDKTSEIPMDYDGAMGVPITFLDKYCPEQFEIIKFRKGDDGKDLSVNGKCPYFRILIKRKK